METTWASICVSILLCASPTFADSRADWVGYDWSTVAPPACLAQSTSGCPLFRGKWDWKRDQWIELAVETKRDRPALDVTLVNRDPSDDDNVCLTVLFQDASGANLAVSHSNLHSDPKSTQSYRGAIVGDLSMKGLSAVQVGSKQCRKGPHQDDDVLKRVVVGLK